MSLFAFISYWKQNGFNALFDQENDLIWIYFVRLLACLGISSRQVTLNT